MVAYCLSLPNTCFAGRWCMNRGIAVISDMSYLVASSTHQNVSVVFFNDDGVFLCSQRQRTTGRRPIRWGEWCRGWQWWRWWCKRCYKGIGCCCSETWWGYFSESWTRMMNWVMLELESPCLNHYLSSQPCWIWWWQRWIGWSVWSLIWSGTSTRVDLSIVSTNRLDSLLERFIILEIDK